MNESQRITRRAFLSLSACVIGAGVASPAQAWASDAGGKQTNVFESLQIERSGNLLTLTDFDSGEIITATIDEGGKSGTIYYPDGSTQRMWVDADGNILIDNVVVSEAVDGSKEIIPTRAVPAGYVYLNRHRTHVSAYQNGYNIILALVGLIPVAGNIVQALSALFHDYSIDDAYIEITQYYHPSTYYIYTVVKYYRYSNYTGLIKVQEFGPNKPV